MLISLITAVLLASPVLKVEKLNVKPSMWETELGTGLIILLAGGISTFAFRSVGLHLEKKIGENISVALGGFREECHEIRQEMSVIAEKVCQRLDAHEQRLGSLEITTVKLDSRIPDSKLALIEAKLAGLEAKIAATEIQAVNANKQCELTQLRIDNVAGALRRENITIRKDER